MQIAVTITESDMELQWFTEPQRLIQPKPQQHTVGQPLSPAVAPPAGGFGHFGRPRFRQVAGEADAVDENGFGGYGRRRPLMQNPLERRRVVVRFPRRLLGHRLQADDLVNASTRNV